VTWRAALQVVTARCGGDPARLAAMGPEEFTALVRGAVPAWGGKKGWARICGRVFAALTDTEGVVAWSRRGLLRRCADELGDLARTRGQLRSVEAEMAAVLDELGLSRQCGNRRRNHVRSFAVAGSAEALGEERRQVVQQELA
jgi:DNA-directed RNA polymerase subunit N (RpoN/RPB10)